MRFATLLGLIASLSALAPAQTLAGVAEILRGISETYKGVSEYELVAEAILKSDHEPAAHVHTRIAFRGPNQYRLEGVMPGLMDDDPSFDQMVAVYDGAALWFYFPKPNQYLMLKAGEVAIDPEASAHTPEATDRVAIQKYRSAAEFIEGAKFLKEEEIEIGAGKVACYVVSVPERWPGPYTWWVDKETHHVLREETSDPITTYTTVRLKQRLPDSLFRFSPPPGARTVDPHG